MATVTKHTFTADTSSWEKGVARMRRASDSFNKNVQKDISGANKAFASLTSSVLGASSGVSKLVGGMATFAAVGAVFQVVGDAVNTMKEFEKANDTLAGISGATAEEMEGLTAQAKMLGSTTMYTATQVTELQTELAKLGFAVPEIKASTDAVLKLAMATGAELGESAALAGATLRAFNLDASEMNRVASVLAVSTTKSALSFEKLSAGMSTVAPVANAFGFSVEDTVAMLGKLSDAGFDASSAATATRNILLNLANSNGKLARALGRPVHNAKELAEGLIELRDRGVDLNEALAMTDKRSVAAFETFLSSAEGVAKLSEELTGCDAALNDMVNTMTDNLQGSLDSMSSAWEGLMLSFSGSNGIIRDVVDSITMLIQGFTKLMQTEEEYAKGRAMQTVAEAESKRNEYIRNEQKNFEGLVKEYQRLNEEQNKGLTDEQIIEAVQKDRTDALQKELAKRKEGVGVLENQISLLKKLADNSESLNKAGFIEKGLGLGISRDILDRIIQEKRTTESWASQIDEMIGEKQLALGEQNAAVIQTEAHLDYYKPKAANQPKVEIETELDIENPEILRKKIKALKKERSGYDYRTNEYANLTRAIDEYQRKLDELTGKTKKNKKGDVGGIDMKLADSVNDALSKGKASDFDSLQDQLIEAMMNAGDASAQAYYASLVDAIRERAEEYKEMESAIVDNSDALSKEIAQQAALNAEIEQTIQRRQKEVEQSQKVIDGLGEIFSESSNALGEFADQSSAAAAAQKMLAAAEAGAALASAVHTAANGGDPYTVVPRIIAATAAVVAALAGMSKFANGGIVGGNSYAGDHVIAGLNSGEMVLNHNQQANLFRLLNSGVGVGNAQQGDVTFRIDGSQLVGSLRNYNRSNNRLK